MMSNSNLLRWSECQKEHYKFVIITACYQTKEVFFSESKYKRDWSPHHIGFSRLIAN